ncbi:MAG: 30S ribosomal protein S17e [Nanoarchaeota archaeon]
MGRIKTKAIKRTTKKLLSTYPDKFKADFEHNKKMVSEVMEIPSKKLRNTVAGYLVRLVKSKKAS